MSIINYSSTVIEKDLQDQAFVQDIIDQFIIKDICYRPALLDLVDKHGKNKNFFNKIDKLELKYLSETFIINILDEPTEHSNYNISAQSKTLTGLLSDANILQAEVSQDKLAETEKAWIDKVIETNKQRKDNLSQLYKIMNHKIEKNSDFDKIEEEINKDINNIVKYLWHDTTIVKNKTPNTPIKDYSDFNIKSSIKQKDMNYPVNINFQPLVEWDNMIAADDNSASSVYIGGKIINFGKD